MNITAIGEAQNGAVLSKRAILVNESEGNIVQCLLMKGEYILKGNALTSLAAPTDTWKC